MIDFFPSRQIALVIGDFPIYWYGVLYLLAFACAAVLLPRLQHLRRLALSKGEWSDILTWTVVGVLVGGRVGYVLLYRFTHFLVDPFLLFDIRSGGMASHGGFIGVTLALLWVMRKRSWNEKYSIADLTVVPVAIGLALGRFGNFLNQELYGTVTDLPWAMSYFGVNGLRHPVQLYAIVKDVVIAVACFLYLRSTASSFIAGRGLALFLMLYGVLRFLVEFVRDQTGVAVVLGLSEGQWLTLPLFFAGLLVWVMRAPRLARSM